MGRVSNMLEYDRTSWSCPPLLIWLTNAIPCWPERRRLWAWTLLLRRPAHCFRWRKKKTRRSIGEPVLLTIPVQQFFEKPFVGKRCRIIARPQFEKNRHRHPPGH